MTISKRILMTITVKGLQQKEVAQKLGVPASTLNTWIKKDASSIPSEYVIPISKIIGVSPLYLLDGSDDEPISTTLDAESKLIEIFRTLNWDGQQEVLHAAVAEKRRISEGK